MIFKKFIEKDLGHVSYIIADENTKESVIIDPRRDIDEYIIFLEENDLILKYIINTHTHADYIGGHLELINIYPNAQNIFQQNAPIKFKCIKVKEKDVFYIGSLQLNILETPGHTPFCISILVKEDNIEKYIFTGDFLFVGDIGRPDLLGEEKLEELIDMSYNSAKKLWNLNHDIIIFTSHIQGSLCGKNLKTQYFSTIGIEKKTNKSLKLVLNENDYKNNLLNLNIETPLFFKKMAGLNIDGPILLKMINEPKQMSYNELLNEYKTEDFIIDFRHPNCFKNSYIKDSINVYEYSNFMLILGSLIDIEKRIFLVGSKKTNFKYIIKKLRRIGFDNIIGVLKDDVNELKGLLKFNTYINEDKVKIIDLDFTDNNSDINVEISKIKTLKFDKEYSYKVICKNGYKSIAVESFLLKSRYNKKV